MLEIITDTDVDANFLILLIVQHKEGQEIEATSHSFFLPGQHVFRVRTD